MRHELLNTPPQDFPGVRVVVAPVGRWEGAACFYVLFHACIG